MDLIDMIRDFIPELSSLDDETLGKFDKLAYTLVEFDPVQIGFLNTHTSLLFDWFGVEFFYAFYDLFGCNSGANLVKMTTLGKELGAATAVELQRREWEKYDKE